VSGSGRYTSPAKSREKFGPVLISAISDVYRELGAEYLATDNKASGESSPRYVEPKDRIATFDQDGTLWTEHPLYTQAMFALHRLFEIAPQHPEWKDKQPFKSVLDGDREAMAKFTEGDWVKIIGVTHSGMDTSEFLAIAKQWITTAKPPRFDHPFTDLIYQPMLELLKHLREKELRTYIVTGGGQEFVRVYSE
jgi:phosphoglycolate phosphatase-like HAD superfamily hydrolase